MSAFAAILRKDLRLEVRTGQSTLALFALSLLILVVLVFALSPEPGDRVDAASGALWVAMVFSGILGATRAIVAEHDNGCIRALAASAADPAAIYAAKVMASFVFMIGAELLAVILVVLFFNLEIGAHLLAVALPLTLGALGFSALATLLAVVSSRTRAGDLLLPLLAVPLFIPALIAGVKSSQFALYGIGFRGAGRWLGIMLAFDVLFIVAGSLLFEHVIRED